MSTFLFVFLCVHRCACIPYVKLDAFKGQNCLITYNSHAMSFYVLSNNSDSSNFVPWSELCAGFSAERLIPSHVTNIKLPCLGG